MFFGGVGPDSSDEELQRIAPDHPVFRLNGASAGTPPPARSRACPRCPAARSGRVSSYSAIRCGPGFAISAPGPWGISNRIATSTPRAAKLGERRLEVIDAEDEHGLVALEMLGEQQRRSLPAEN